METKLDCRLHETGVFKLKADLMPVSNLLIRINTHKDLDKVKQNFLKGRFKELPDKNKLRGTYELHGTKFDVLIDFKNELREKSAMDYDYDRDYPMQLVITLDYKDMKLPQKEEAQREKFVALIKSFLKEYETLKIIRNTDSAKSA